MLVGLNVIVFVVGAFDYSVVEPKDISENSSNNCLIDRDGRYVIFLVFSVVKVIAWGICIKLLIYQYRKGLSELWYSHKMFWVLSCVI